MDSDSVRRVNRRRLLGWGGLAAGGVVAAGAVPLMGFRSEDAVAAGQARPAPTGPEIPPDARPGGAYDRYVAKLAAEGRFSGVVLLSHHGRTVLSRSYGMADKEKGIRNHEGIAFSLSSAGKPFHAVALLQLAQQGRVKLADTLGTHLKGFAANVADRVTVHHLLSGTSGLDSPGENVRHVFQSRKEVHADYTRRARQARPVGVPGVPDTAHAQAEVTIAALIVEAVSGTTYWDYVQENIFKPARMTGSAFYTRPQWLTDKHLAHPYMTMQDGTRLDALRNLDKSSPGANVLGKNPGRAFIDAPGDGGFATAPDLVRFARALQDGTLLDRPWADVLTGAKIPHGPVSFGAYGITATITKGQWRYQRAGANPGVAANWTIYPNTGWVGVVLGNCDDVPLQEMLDRETQAITGAAPGGGGGGGGG
ncbi:class A beta-lactamase-related serine hydrolase [Actinomadura logoneensis]|uniref:Class A beta-lactamase-related serine hydrolase n=1 Tax=Actinomadura logoneensis TaxID=2293572 RepID=A0A372JJD0_9ACTN|nr:serine hydrolase domain-containing protein [Actinomadura logoneensis]RFU39964.1 class A beta-lactamase-related serine hydrolase [Actinomadura logoneensis]